MAGLIVGLLAAACFDLKAHLLVLAGVMAAAWWAFQRRFELRALAGLVVGAFVGAAPPLIMRWIDSGNPLLPAYNNIFHSPYWPPVNEQFNFPYLHHPGALGPLSALARSVTDTGALQEAAPIGSFGLLVGAVVIAMALGWARTRDGRRPALVLWIAVVAAFLAWYAQFRYLRYLLPAATVSLIALLLLAPAGRLRPRVQIGAVVGTVGLAALLWPVAVAEFWNVPGRDIPVEAAFGFRNADDYEKASMPERDALAAYNRVAPPGALAVSDPYQRVWLTGGRDLEPGWELTARLKTKGPLPTTPAQMLARYRQLGVTWVIVQNGGALAGDKQVAALVDRYGQLEYRDATASVYRLTPTPVRPAAFAAAPAAAGAPLTVPVCTGEVVVADVHADGGSTPVTAAITLRRQQPPCAHPDGAGRAGHLGRRRRPGAAGGHARHHHLAGAGRSDGAPHRRPPRELHPMTFRFVATLLAYVTSSTIGLVLMRHELRQPDVNVISVDSLTNWRLICAVLLYAVSFAFWLLALSRYPLTTVYPVFVGIGYSAVTLCAIFFLHEHLTVVKAFGLGFVGVGLLLLVAR